MHVTKMLATQLGIITSDLETVCSQLTPNVGINLEDNLYAL